jgi:hypothetical protein
MFEPVEKKRKKIAVSFINPRGDRTNSNMCKLKFNRGVALHAKSKYARGIRSAKNSKRFLSSTNAQQKILITERKTLGALNLFSLSFIGSGMVSERLAFIAHFNFTRILQYF